MKGDDVAATPYEAAFVLTSKGQAAGTKKAALGSFPCSTFSQKVAMYGAADGTRTRDPRRDRPVF